jgi:hypothetical protein
MPGRLAVPLVAAALIVGALPAPVAAAGIVFDGSPGTGAPPATLGGYPMTPFGPDGYVYGQTVSSVPAPGGGSVGFSYPGWVFAPASGLNGGWTPGYTGNAYIFTTVTTPSVTLTMPAGTKAFYFYAEPYWCGPFTVTATANDGTTSGPVSVPSDCSQLAARYFGFYTTGSTTLASISVTGGGGAPDTSVIAGEFGISFAAPAPPAPRPTDVPTVVGLSPGAGKVGSSVTILGTSFSYANKVTFNGVPTTFSVRSPTTIVATVPRGATTGPVRVFTPFGSSQSARSFYVLP